MARQLERVLMLSDTDGSRGGGVNEVIAGLGAALSDLGLNIGYLYGRGESQAHLTYLSGMPKALQVYDLGLRAMRLAKVLRRIEGQYDVLHVHGAGAMYDAVLALRLMRRHEAILLIGTLHGTDTAVAQALIGEMRRGRASLGPKHIGLAVHYGFSAAKEHVVYKRMHGLIACAEGVAKQAQRSFGVRPTFIANGIDCSRFGADAGDALERSDMRSMYGIPPDANLILYVGHPAWRKGLSYMLEAFKRLDQSYWLLTVGSELAPHGRVRAISALPSSRMPSVYKSADIFCTPSVYDAMSIALLEAMATGLPCISTDTPSGLALIRHRDNGLITPMRNTRKLVDAILELRDPALRARLGAAARKTAWDLSWNSAAVRTLEFYNAQRALQGV